MNQQSPIETLRQLREMLDAGTITPTEFDQLKQQLIFAAQAPATPAQEATPSITDAAVASPAPAEQHSPLFEDARLPPGSIDLDAGQVNEASLAEAVTSLRSVSSDPAATELVSPDVLPARNPLNLVLAIGGLLVLLAVFAYLTFNQHDSEHISSGSLTAADSVQVVEEGPQAEAVEQPVALPETVRVAPANPAPPIVKPSATPAATDSAAMPSTPAADTAQRP